MSQPPLSGRTQSAAWRSDILSALSAFGADLVGATTPTDIAQCIARTLETLLSTNRLLVVLDGPDGTPHVMHAAGPADPHDDLPLIALARDAGPLLLSSHAGEELAVRGITLPRPPQSWIGAPVRTHVPLGAVSIGSDTPGRFAREELEIVTAVVTQSALALEKTRLVSLLSIGKREWEQTVDALGQGICVVDRQGAIRRANRAFGALVGVSLTDIPGKPCIGLVPPAWAEVVGTMLTPPVTAKSCELRAGPRQIVLTLLPLSGIEEGAVLIFDDQTDKRRLQDQLIQSEKMSAIGQLIAGIAHDLNNPLASVIGFADYLVESSDRVPPELAEPLRAIQQEAERAANIVRNLLTYARKQERRRRSLPLEPLLSSTLLLLRNELIADKAESHLEIAPDLPEVDVDSNQIQQVFVNLISNAAQAVASGGEPGRIVVRAVRWLDGVAVTVEDDGPGVPADVAHRVFEPFFTTKPEGEGTGLGLSICQGIVKEHGGRLTLESAGGRGAVFRVELPASTTARPAPAAPPPAPPGMRPLRVLVIDDEPHIQHYMRATLESWGHTVAVAGNGVEGLERASGESFDIIISDLRMPEMGGREMFEALRRTRPEMAVRVVFSTGDTIRGDALDFLESLGRPYLRKPFTLAELRAAIASATPTT
ncbi:MAG TPA: ATP-binding protein [Gemmatimonadales bacterium]